MVFSYLITARGTRVLFVVLAGIGAYFLAKRSTSTGSTPLVLLFLGTMGVLMALGVEQAMADDGGWRECGSSFSRWASCSGSDRVRLLALWGAAGSGVGSALGPSLGEGMGAGPSGGSGEGEAGGGGGDPELSEERREAVRRIMESAGGTLTEREISEALSRILEAMPGPKSGGGKTGKTGSKSGGKGGAGMPIADQEALRRMLEQLK